MRTYVIALACLLATSAHASLPPTTGTIRDMMAYTVNPPTQCELATRWAEDQHATYRNDAAVFTRKKPTTNKRVYTVDIKKLPALLKKAGFKEQAAELVVLLANVERTRSANCTSSTASK